MDSTRVCVWCGDASAQLSREHVVPLWLDEVLEGSGDFVHTRTEHGAAGPMREWLSSQPDFKVRRVCKKRCNSGWMAELEHRAKPRVTGLVTGRARSLSRVDCAVVARWAAKTALGFPLMDPDDESVIPKAAFGELFAAGNPSGLPDTLRLWASQVDAHGVSARSAGGSLRLRDGAVAPIFLVLLRFDRFGLLVAGCRDPRALATFKLGQLDAAWSEISHRRSGMTRAPRHRLTQDEFDATIERLPLAAPLRI